LAENKNIVEFDAQSDGIDLKKIFRSFFRSWPVIILCFAFWILFGVFLLKIIPPTYQLKTSILVEEPQRMYDPYRFTLGPQNFNPPDDEYFVNEKIRIKSLPLIQQTIDSLDLNVSYFKQSFRKDEIYLDAPFRVNAGKEWFNERSDLLFNVPISVKLLDNNAFQISVTGESFASKSKININETYQFGESIILGDGTIKITKNNNSSYKEGNFAFTIRNPKEVLIEYTDKLEVETEELNATVMGVYINGASPQKQIDFLNTLGGIYINEHLKEKRRVYSSVKQYLDNELAKLGEDLKAKENRLSSFKEINKVSNLSRQAGSILSQTNKLANEEVNLKVRQKYYDYLRDFMENADNYEKLISPQAFKIKDPILIDLTNELVQLQMEKNHLKVEGHESNPSFAFISSKIEAIKKSILETVDGFNTSNLIRLEDIKAQMNELDSDARTIPGIEREYIALERDFTMSETAYLNMMEKKADSDIAIGSVVSDFRIIEPAHLMDTKPFFPNKLVIAAIVLLFTALSILVYMIYKLAFRSKITELDELNNVLRDVPMDGLIDFSNLTSLSDFEKYKNSFTVENFKSLMLKINERTNDKAKVFSITSHNINEGKSHITAGLAHAFAEDGKKVIVLDTNELKPKQHELLNCSDTRNLSDYFNGDVSLKDSLLPTLHDNISLVNGGKLQSVISLSGKEKVLKLFSELNKLCDCLIIDTSPLSLVSNVQEILKISDRNLFVFRRNISDKEDWLEAKRIISEEVISKTSFVFNGDIEKYSGLSRGAKKYYKNRRKGLLYLLKKQLSKV